MATVDITSDFDGKVEIEIQRTPQGTFRVIMIVLEENELFPKQSTYPFYRIVFDIIEMADDSTLRRLRGVC